MENTKNSKCWTKRAEKKRTKQPQSINGKFWQGLQDRLFQVLYSGENNESGIDWNL